MNFPSAFYRWRPHPWHGLKVGPQPPQIVHAYIELTPFDLVKYEIDKETGYIKVDRPQQFSSQPPALYGFIPRTFCGERVKGLMTNAQKGDGDPLDICVISERPINRSEVILNAHVIGGLPMLDDNEADDKIIAILENDNVWTNIDDITDLPKILVERLRHYFLTYKLVPGKESKIYIGDSYGSHHACQVIEAAIADYEEHFGVS